MPTRCLTSTSSGKMTVGARFSRAAVAHPKIATAASLARRTTTGRTGSGSRMAESRASTTSASHCATARSATVSIDSEM